MQRIRISKNAFAAGFRLKHIGEVLYASVKMNLKQLLTNVKLLFTQILQSVQEFVTKLLSRHSTNVMIV